MLRSFLVKGLLGLTLALGLGLAALGLYAQGIKAHRDHLALQLAAADARVQELEEANAGLQALRERDQAALASARRQKAAIAREMAALRLSLTDALAANRAWADQPVPKEVQDALAQP